MKKAMIFAALAAIVSLASCQKENTSVNGNDENAVSTTASPVFTASIAGATKTTVDLSNGKIAWEASDEITVTDAAENPAVYTIKSIDSETGKATFEIKTGEATLGNGPFTATYGAEPATEQTYSATAGKLYMAAPATSDNSLTFTVQCGLMRLNLTKADESVKSIAVTSSTDETYTLTCDPAESISSAKDFYISLPQGAYTKIVITDSRGWKCTKTVKSAPLSVLTNHIKPVTFTSLYFCSDQLVLSINDAYADLEPQSGIPSDIWGKQW